VRRLRVDEFCLICERLGAEERGVVRSDVEAARRMVRRQHADDAGLTGGMGTDGRSPRRRQVGRFRGVMQGLASTVG
jgi:hypothetical protein